jgi:endogenous inhibitor of DNA gyrase (YacG/DUF329 family)
MKLPVLKCKRPGCGHEWIPRKHQLPKVCPACKQIDWDDDKRTIPMIDEATFMPDDLQRELISKPACYEKRLSNYERKNHGPT